MAKTFKERNLMSASGSDEFFAAFEEARKMLGLDRANFVRLCVAEKIHSLGIKIPEPIEQNQAPQKNKKKK